MKNNLTKIFSLLLAIFMCQVAFAQQPSISNFRPYDRTGINMFETPKNNNTKFDGLKVRIGGGFTQQFQSLSHENTALAVSKTFSGVVNSNTNKLYEMTAGFNTAMANLNFDVQLEDGVLLNLTTYLSAKHHNEAWVKGGYIQFDKLAFLGSSLLNDIMDNVTIKVGHMEVNYGDAHFRRSDGGQTMYNPFIENYIVDEFATEIGGEVYYKHSGFIGMFGMTSGEIKGALDPVAATTVDKDTAKAPAILFKVGYDNKIGDDMRLRLTASGYMKSSGSTNTLFGGDRTGSNYSYVMELAKDGTNAKPALTAVAFSGRLNPGFTDKINTYMVNLFWQMGGIELFGTFETAAGRSNTEVTDRKMTQIAADLLYRFGKVGYVGGRFNSVTAQLKQFNGPAATDGSVAQFRDSKIGRIAVAAGWFVTDNVLMKAEYVQQTYTDFYGAALATDDMKDYRSGGKFNGIVVEAVVGF
ncbi:MAG: hypothetical protein NTW25_07225 [Candidatus Kapabacteria bacterium]|nr:hypothetical protein [Candidatus Kapabacteria bacterium]